MPDTLRLAGALLAPHSHQESDLLDGDLYARLAASETVAGLWGFPAAGIRIGQEALSSPADGVLAVDGDLAVGGSISLDGTVDGVDVSDHGTLHERGGSQMVRAARLHSGTDADKPSSGNTEGDVWWAADTDKLYVWNGAAWKEIGAAGGGGSVAVEEADVQVVAAASVLDFGAGFDITEGPSGEANIGLDLTEAVWTFAQGGFRFRDGSGPLLSTGASGDDLNLAGDLDVSGHAALGAEGAIDASRILNIDDQNMSGAPATALYCGSRYTGSSGSVYYRALWGANTYAATGGSAAGVIGLAFSCFLQSSQAVGIWSAMDLYLRSYASQAGPVTNAFGLRIGHRLQGAVPTTYRGIYLYTDAGLAWNTFYGIHIPDVSGTTVYLLELGPATPYLRLVGGAAPGANQTNLYLYEGSTPALRQVQWKAGNALGASDKVLVLV